MNTGDVIDVYSSLDPRWDWLLNQRDDPKRAGVILIGYLGKEIFLDDNRDFSSEFSSSESLDTSIGDQIDDGGAVMIVLAMQNDRDMGEYFYALTSAGGYWFDMLRNP